MALITIAHNAVTARLIGADRSLRQEVQRLLSYKVAGAEMSELFKSRRWDGRSSFYEWATDKFPAGFVTLVFAHLTRAGHSVKLARNPFPAPLGPEKPVVDAFPEDPDRAYQMETVNRLLRHGKIVARLATGCHAKGQKVLMFDGSLKAVEDVVVGDKLMGPDSRPRNVLALHRGTQTMHRIKPLRYGREFVVNAGHILSLEQTKLPDTHWQSARNGQWTNISVDEYLRESIDFKHIWKLHRSKGIDFPAGGKLPLDPYLLGVILGDGHIRSNGASGNCSVAITSADQEIVDYIQGWVDKNDHRLKISKKVGTEAMTLNIARRERHEKKVGENQVGSAIIELGLRDRLSDDKFIPEAYKTASRADRLAILAGLLDTDGHLHNGYFEFVSKSPMLAADMAFIARSLGFAVSESVKTISRGTYAGRSYHRITISGHIDAIPVLIERKKANPRLQKKDVHLSGFEVEEVGEGEYFGFEVDDDNLYLLDDFTITHNSGKSRVAKLAYARIGRMTLFLTTRSILMHQMKDAFEADMGIKVGVLGDGEWSPRKGMNVGMVQTLMARLKDPDERATKAEKEAQRVLQEKTRQLLAMFELVILEEAHEAGGNSYFEIMNHCTAAHYRLALTGTPFMRDDEEDNMRLQAVAGPVAIKVTEQELIQKGILAKPYFKIIRLKEIPDRLKRTTPWQRAYKYGVVENQHRNLAIVREVVAGYKRGLTAMVLVQQTAHGDILRAALTKAGLRVSYIRGENDQDERKREIGRLKNNEIDVLIGTNILDVGVDVPAVGMVVLGGGGKAEVALRQRIGRGLRAKKFGPNVCFVVDFHDDGNQYMKEHAKQRFAIISGTPGFAEGILPEGADFPFDELGLKLKNAAQDDYLTKNNTANL